MFSIWEKETVLAPQDVVIAGGGFAGLWTAFHLLRRYPKARIAVLEKDFMSMGASTRNAGFACFGSLGELVADATEIGNDSMLDLVALRYRGLKQIRKYWKPSDIDLDWCGGYELFPPGGFSSEVLAENIEYINRLLRPITGEKHTFRECSNKISRFGFGNTSAMVVNEGEGALHAGKLAGALRRHLQRKGVQLLHSVSVTAFTEESNSVEVHTDRDFSVKAHYLAVCTNTAAGSLLPELSVTPARGQVLLTSPIEGLPWRGTFHADEGYYYFRNLGNRVLLGGARNKAFDEERSNEHATTPLIQGELERFLNEVILPGKHGTYSIELRWSGIMGMGTDKYPVMGSVRPRILAAVALGGIGVAVAPEAGRKLAKLVNL
ncbi:NAD(P)/FAD-dependent oxidoreductase [Flaviaesturariibacter flavus]|nr:FAD-dependent oxidoreductase [Flaviaesturariibacter flavus]